MCGIQSILAGWCASVWVISARVTRSNGPGSGERPTTPLGTTVPAEGAGSGPARALFPVGEPRQAIHHRHLAVPTATDVRELAARSDVLIENYRVGGLARYGLDYDSLRGLNPRLVYCSITGFGQTGPARARPGYDFMIQAEGGIMSLTGEADDRPGGGPTKAGIAVSDLFAGMYAVQAVLAALLERERSGEGQYIDLALLDSTVASLSRGGFEPNPGSSPPRLGNAHPHVVPYRALSDQRPPHMGSRRNM